MHSLTPEFLKRLSFSAEELGILNKLGEFKGKEELFARQTPDTLHKLLENAIIESTESSNRIEGITASRKRITQIVRGSTEPRGRSEQEIAGYRDVLNTIHQSHAEIPLNRNIILQFHAMLYRYTTKPSGQWKTSENRIIEKHSDGTELIRFETVPAFDTPRFMEQMDLLWTRQSADKGSEPLVLVPLLVLDFLCVHPFSDGNGRVARLLTLLLLYQAGYRVGKYISLERIVDRTKESYYETLGLSSRKWHDGRHDPHPWLNYFWGTLIGAYREFETRVGVFKGKGSKTEQIIAQIDRFVKPFSISELEKNCPNISRDMIRTILRKLRIENKLRPIGIGRSAKWEKSNKWGNGNGK